MPVNLRAKRDSPERMRDLSHFTPKKEHLPCLCFDKKENT